jgi:acyl-CoA synthetase (AMP-forming)/AMP-acid ligase II
LRADSATVNALFERAAGFQGVGLRLLDRAERQTWYEWPELYRRALEACGGLQALGIEPGDRVALVFPTCVEFFDLFFGVLLAGAVPVPVYPPVRLGRLDEYTARTERMLTAVSARVVVADPLVRRLLGQAVRVAAPELGCPTPRDLPARQGLPVAVTADDLALVQFSSGTTLDPNPVALSHRAVVAQAELLNRFWPDRSDRADSGVSWLPLYHDMGLIGCVLPAIERPGTLTLIPPEVFLARPAVWLRAISRYGATLSVAPNFAYGLCVEKIRDEDLEGVDLSGWRVAVNGAEPVVPAVLRGFAERFGRWGLRPEALTPVYGLSEAALAVTFSDVDRPFGSRRFDRESLSLRGEAVEAADGLELVSLGRPMDGFELRFVDEGGGAVPAGQVGRLLVRGPSLMEGYFARPEMTLETLCDGWLDTGDLGFEHSGELFLTGRAKDVLILRGRSHSPTEVEAAADGVAGVRTGCSVAVSWLPEGADGEVLLVLVEARRSVPEASYAGIAEGCMRTVRAATGLVPYLVEVLPAGTLPRTSSGKLRRQESLRRYLSGELCPPDSVTPLRLAGTVARSTLELARMRWHGRR